MSALYAGGHRQAVVEATKAFATSKGIKDPATVKKLVDEFANKVGPLVDKWARTDAEARADAAAILRHSFGRAAGKVDDESRKALNLKSYADLRSRHPSNKAVSDLIHATNQWLKQEHPETHRALHDSEGLGSAPRFVRRLTDAYSAHKAEAERRARGSKWVGKARGPAPVAGAGMLSGARR